MNDSSTCVPQDTARRLTRWPAWFGQEHSASHSDVVLLCEPAPTFAEETAILLRSRLKSYSLISLLVLCFFFAINLTVDPWLLLGVRVVVILVVAACYAFVRWKPGLTPRQLHGLELATLLILAAHLTIMMTARIIIYAGKGDPVSLTAVQQGYMGGWVLLELAYGLFIPIPWRRAAALLLPVGLLPPVLLYLLAWLRGDVASTFAQDHVFGCAALPLVAAVVAVYAAHSIYQIRQTAFEGQRFGQYLLGQPIGSGGMGQVYRADHLLLKRPCAIKLIRPDRSLDEQTINRFEAEVRATAQLSHCNTVEIYDFGRASDGTLYYVMELLRGTNFDELVQKHGPLPPERVVHLLRQIRGALGEAHASGMVHRDIKPSNIFAAERGGVYDFAKLLDFGLVRQISDETALDEQLGFGGSPHFMAPEQFADYAAVDARSDIYALGAVGYFLLTGRPPFGGRWIKELRDAHGHQAVTRPSLVRPSTPSDLESVLLRCLAKVPADRFASAESLAAALDACECANLWTDERARQWWHDHPPGSLPAKREGAETLT